MTAENVFGHRWLWREFYNINRNIWPDMGRIESAWGAFGLACKTWKVKG